MNEVDSLLEEVGVALDPSVGVALTGSDPVLATDYPLGLAAGSAIAATAAVAAQVWHDATGEGQDVTVDVPRAAESLVSFLLQRIDGVELMQRHRGFAETTRLVEARDGRWIHLHGGFPHLAAGTLDVLGCEADLAAVDAAVASRDAFELEEALAAAGMCGAVARTRDEWAAHPQQAALAPMGRVVVRKVADGEPIAAVDRHQPFGAIKALDLTRLLAGPTCGRTLAAHGADVLLVSAGHLATIDAFVMDTSHGKRSACLDLDDAAQAERLRQLVGEADVFVQGYRGRSMAERGFGAEALAEGHRGLVHVSVDCYGHVGPWQDRPGWEQLAQSASGLVLGHSAGKGRPEILPGAICDYTTGHLAALGAAAALRRRASEGGSYAVEVSLTQTAWWVGGLPLVDGSAAAGLPHTALVTSDSGWGELHHLPPVPQLAPRPPGPDRRRSSAPTSPPSPEAEGRVRLRRRPSRAPGCGACRAGCACRGGSRRAVARSW